MEFFNRTVINKAFNYLNDETYYKERNDINKIDHVLKKKTINDKTYKLHSSLYYEYPIILKLLEKTEFSNKVETFKGIKNDIFDYLEFDKNVILCEILLKANDISSFDEVIL